MLDLTVHFDVPAFLYIGKPSPFQSKRKNLLAKKIIRQKRTILLESYPASKTNVRKCKRAWRGTSSDAEYELKCFI